MLDVNFFDEIRANAERDQKTIEQLREPSDKYLKLLEEQVRSPQPGPATIDALLELATVPDQRASRIMWLGHLPPCHMDGVGVRRPEQAARDGLGEARDREVAADRVLVRRARLRREPAGGGCPGRYLPVSTPWAIGDHTICPSPNSREVGTTSGSMTRQSIEYCGWLETRGTRNSRASSAAARISSARHSETPM